MELEDLILDIAKEGVRNKYSNSNEEFVKQKLRQRLALKEKLDESWTKKKHLLRQLSKK